MENEEKKPEETPDRIDEAKKVVEQLKLENDRRQALLDREERLRANALIGGVTDNAPKDEPVKEETPQEYAKRITEGRV